MEHLPITLTEFDKLILEEYCNLAEGLGEYLGDCYELVVHSFSSFDHSVIKIVNNHSGRKEGSPITDLGLSMVKSLSENDSQKHMAYFNKTMDGVPLKSCSIAITGEKGYIIGLLCINYYLNTPLSDVLSILGMNNNETHPTAFAESFVDDVDELLKISLKEASDIVYNDRNITTSNKNKEIIAILNDKGIFNFKDSVVKIADMMGISKNTVYMHIRNIAKK